MPQYILHGPFASAVDMDIQERCVRFQAFKFQAAASSLKRMLPLFSSVID
jgi:hypothetical protein